MTEVHFDPQALIDNAIEGAMDTDLPQMAPGEYEGQIVNVPLPEIINTKEGKSVIFKPKIRILNPPEDGIEYPDMAFTVWLDVNAEGRLDMRRGKNIGLGRLREAVGQNDPSKPWSLNDLMGCEVKVLVGQIPQKKDPTKMYSRIENVTAKG